MIGSLSPEKRPPVLHVCAVTTVCNGRVSMKSACVTGRVTVVRVRNVRMRARRARGYVKRARCALL